MFKIGDKVKGFKFDGDEYPMIGWTDEMDDVVGAVGEVNYIGGESYSVHFKDSDVCWGYPKDLWYLGKVEETQSFQVGEDVSFKVGDKVIPSFQIGDRVKFKKSSIDSGMIDATEDDVFEVSAVFTTGVQINRGDYFQVFAFCHFEHVKEEIMNNTEKQEIKWEVGQEVWCLLRGKGVVECVGENDGTPYVVGVDFGYTFDNYTIDGKIMDDHKGRVLFFSEPKIEAEKFPPKKLFVPAFQKGDVVAVKWADTVQILILEQETERQVKGNCGQVWDKDPDVHFYKLGEEIKFN